MNDCGPVAIHPVALPHGGLPAMAAEARTEGHEFVDRLIAEHLSGENCFGRPGDCLLGVTRHNALIAIGGLNADPYMCQPGIGRLRHLYVSRPYRRQAIARHLVQALLQRAAGHFHIVHLRTANPRAAALYQACGFSVVRSATASHEISITGSCKKN